MQNSNSKAITYGAIGGVISIFLTLVFYFMGPNSFSNMWLGLGVLLISIVLTVVLFAMAINHYKKMNGGHISFKSAFREAFLTGVTMSVISLLFGILFFGFIDPDFGQQASDAIKESTIERMEKWNTPDEVIEKQVAKLEKQGNRYSITNQVKGLIPAFIFYGFIGLIMAAILKKKKPEIIEEV